MGWLGEAALTPNSSFEFRGRMSGHGACFLFGSKGTAGYLKRALIFHSLNLVSPKKLSPIGAVREI